MPPAALLAGKGQGMATAGALVRVTDLRTCSLDGTLEPASLCDTFWVGPLSTAEVFILHWVGLVGY